MLQKLSYNLEIAFESLANNKLRSLLTSLGLIFGVASVIAMLAIGKGAEQEILQQIKVLGANNVIVRPSVEQQEGAVEDASAQNARAAEKRPYSPGLTMADARSIATTVPRVTSVSPEVVVETNAVRAGLRRTTKLVGVDRNFFTGPQNGLAEGRSFSEAHLREAAPVAIIGQAVKTKFFPGEDPVGQRIKCGRLWLTVVGVMEPRSITDRAIENLGIRDYNYDIYTPITTMLLRFEDRARVTPQDVQQAEREARDNDEGEAPSEPVNYHQLDRLVVRVDDSRYMKPVADVVSRMLERRHHAVTDYQVIIPEQLLAQEQRTQTIFNIVLAAIASISLVVGGIGIMNIMLASVMERIREIGVRRSVGATARDVVLQFLIEALTISFVGGIIGIVLGWLLSFGIEASTGIRTIVSPVAVLLAFLVSAGVGLIFGLLPAKRAAEQDPVVALRHE